ncbi:hypothetical protein BT96DRAFT_1010411 [Gymnopus androsaceus JB14]|uniref:Chromo domain-containing protein n=1 Tax=Gymnopus androsaceus JB14 TaxID=1447944 RepID=A0A6A4GAS6_9AGAR|nr:hypothetical protein BT96DRAFT_1010411 [Gymnopus androsaceus JB14]
MGNSHANVIVEKLVDHCEVSGGQTEYLVKWVGWPHYENTWELEKNLKDLDVWAEYQIRHPELSRHNQPCLTIIIPSPTSSRRVVQ